MNQFKRKLTAFSAMLAFLSLSSAATYAATSADVLGTANASVTDVSSALTRVTNTSNKQGGVAQVDWGKFSVPKNQTVDFAFTAHSQTIINRVLGGEQSNILGKLTNSCANSACDSLQNSSKVLLINPAGIVFGAGSMVDLNSFTASTFDVRGAKNLKDIANGTDSTYANINDYQLNFLNKLSPVAASQGGPENSTGAGQIYLDSNYKDAFTKAGINMNNLEGKTFIKLNGTTFDDIDGAGNLNKSVALLSDNVDYKDSLIRTGQNFNYAGNTESHSNVRIITADGVNFTYGVSGNAKKASVKSDSDAHSNVERQITMNNSGLGNNQAIKSGEVDIYNYTKNADSDINMTNTLIRATKLINEESGAIKIVGTNDVNIASSRLDTVNTITKNNNNETVNTNAQTGGQISIKSGNLNLDDSTLFTSGSTTNDATAGSIVISSTGNSTVNNSEVVANGNLTIASAGKTNIDGSALHAANTINKAITKEVNIQGGKEVNVNNTHSISTGDTNIKTTAAQGGKVTISADNNQSDSVIVSRGNLGIYSNDTKIDNAALAYKTIKFYNTDTPVNNVTIANDATFSPSTYDAATDKYKVSYDINLETNGNMTLDNATMNIAKYNYSFNHDANDNLIDNGGVHGITYSASVTPLNPDNLTITSTGGNVNVINGTNVDAYKNITMNANNGSYTQENSALNAGHVEGNTTYSGAINITAKNNVDITGNHANGTAALSTSGNPTNASDITVTAANGDVTITNANVDSKYDANVNANKGAVNLKGSEVKSQNNDVNINAYKTIAFGNGANDNIDSASALKASKNVKVTSANGDITGEKATLADIEYGSRLGFNAKNKIAFTAKQGTDKSFQAVNTDFNAKEVSIDAKDDVRLVDTTFTSTKNSIASGDDVVLNDVKIFVPTGKTANDVVTLVNAGGNVTTADLADTTGAKAANVKAGQPHTYIQNVEFGNKDLTIAEWKEQDYTDLDVNKTKLVVETQAQKTTPLSTAGSVTLKLDDADGQGIVVKAENIGGWDGASDISEGPEVYLTADSGDKIAISTIVTDKLTLDKNVEYKSTPMDTNYLTRAQQDQIMGTKNEAYIEIRDYNGFNLHDDVENGEPDGYEYTISDPGTEVSRIDNGDGTDTVRYDHDSHLITFDNNEKVNLIYKVPETKIEQQPTCPPEPTDAPSDDDEFDASSLMVTLPREQVEVSRTSAVSDGTADQTGNIMSAAAKVDLGSGDTSDREEDEEDEAEE